MPIYFRNTPVSAPFMFETVGNHWRQIAVDRPAGYPHFHYLHTESGIGRIDVQGKYYRLHEHEGILLAPSIPHSYHPESREWIVSFATFTGTLPAGISFMLQERPVTLISQKQGILLEPLIEKAVELHQAAVPDVKTISACCYEFLLCFTDCAAHPKILDDPLYQRLVAPVIKEIETRYQEELTVQGLSALVYVTPQYLSRLFRRFLGKSVYEYLTIYRISRAREFLLSRPHDQIQDIARAVGFSDPSHFIAMFKKVTGSTPLEFRRLY